MNNKNKLSFRQESIDNVFSNDTKPFEISSPPKLTTYTISVIAFLVFFVAALYYIKLPVHVKAMGEIFAGKDYHQITISDDNMNVHEILAYEGDSVTQGQILMKLKNRDESRTKNDIKDLNIQIESLEYKQVISNKNYQQSLNITETLLAQQIRIIELTTKSFKIESVILSRFIDNQKAGLIPAREKDAHKRLVSNIENSLIREQVALTNIQMNILNLTELYTNNKDDNEKQLKRLRVSKQSLENGLQVLSPCECTVDNILTKKNTPVSPGQSLLTLSTARDSSEVVLYVPANQYRELKRNSVILLNVEAYPSQKFGATKAKIQSVSSLPIPGSMLKKKSQFLTTDGYFIVKAVVSESPANVKLITGMTINSDIVIDEKSLFSTVFNF